MEDVVYNGMLDWLPTTAMVRDESVYSVRMASILAGSSRVKDDQTNHDTKDPE